MSDYLPFVVLGITTGSIYALAAVGLVLTYRTSGVFNFAHGAQAAVAAYLMHELWQGQGLPWPVAAAMALLVAGVLLGLLLERVTFGLSGAPTVAQVAATVGLLVALNGIIGIRYGFFGQPFGQYLPEGSVGLPSVTIQLSQIVITVLAAVTAGLLYLFFRRSRQGIAMQAVVEDPVLLGLEATNPVAVRRQAWLIGSCVAAMSGMLLAPTVGLDATVLILIVVQAFGAAAIGAFDSLALTYLGGLVVGLATEISKKVIVDNPSLQGLGGLPSTIPFLILFVVLLVAKRERLVERGAQVARRVAPPAPVPPRVQALGLLAGGLLLVSLPALVGANIPSYTLALVFVVVFASLGLLAQTSGQVSLCHLAFAGIGASMFVNAQQAGLPWLAAVVVGGLVTVPFGAVVAVPALRLSGVYLAIATFGFGILIERLLFPSSLLFGQQLQLPAVAPAGFSGDTGYYYACLAVVVASLVAIVGVRRSRLGRLLRGLGESPSALAAHGTSPTLIVVILFCISAFFAGVAGALIGPITGTASALSFGYFESLLLIPVLFIAGRRPVLSALLAAGLYVVAPTYITNERLVLYLPVLFGLTALVLAVGPGRFLVQAFEQSKRGRERLGRPMRPRAAPAPVGAGR